MSLHTLLTCSADVLIVPKWLLWVSAGLLHRQKLVRRMAAASESGLLAKWRSA
jgi:hypothetical protein